MSCCYLDQRYKPVIAAALTVNQLIAFKLFEGASRFNLIPACLRQPPFANGRFACVIAYSVLATHHATYA